MAQKQKRVELLKSVGAWVSLTGYMNVKHKKQEILFKIIYFYTPPTYTQQNGNTLLNVKMNTFKISYLFKFNINVSTRYYRFLGEKRSKIFFLAFGGFVENLK